MASVNDVSKTLLDNMNGTTSSTKKSTAQEAQDRFMTLLVTQMKNQDPLNPLDNAQVTSQLAQLSTVTGIDTLNKSITSLMGSYQTTQSISMIGHGVLLPGSTTNLTDGKAIFGMELSEPADNVTVTIKNSAGAIVRTLDLGAQKEGAGPVMWDGKNDQSVTQPDGDYKFTITATRAGKTQDTPVALTFDSVLSVSTGATGVKLNLSNSGSVAVSDIHQVL